MQKIGSGCQFEIFDLENGKVLRLPLSDNKVKKKIKRIWWWFILLGLVPNQTKNMLKIRQDGINFFKENKSKRHLVGNIKFKKEGIIQDKVTPISNLILKDFSKDKELIDKYCNFLLTCIKNGFLEREYNFSDNYGINKKNEIILIDFGEVRFTKKEVKRDIEKNRWKMFYRIRPKFRGKTKRYYKKKIKDLLTIKTLDKYWGIER